jgi:hypothetical protein
MLFEPQSTQRTQRMRIAEGLHEEHLMTRISKLILVLQDLLMAPDGILSGYPLRGALEQSSTLRNYTFFLWSKTVSASAFVCGRLRLICRAKPVPDNPHLCELCGLSGEFQGGIYHA